MKKLNTVEEVFEHYKGSKHITIMIKSESIPPREGVCGFGSKRFINPNDKDESFKLIENCFEIDGFVQFIRLDL